MRVLDEPANVSDWQSVGFNATTALPLNASDLYGLQANDVDETWLCTCATPMIWANHVLK